ERRRELTEELLKGLERDSIRGRADRILTVVAGCFAVLEEEAAHDPAAAEVLERELANALAALLAAPASGAARDALGQALREEQLLIERLASGEAAAELACTLRRCQVVTLAESAHEVTSPVQTVKGQARAVQQACNSAEIGDRLRSLKAGLAR